MILRLRPLGLKQDQFMPLPVEKQVMIIFLAARGYLDDIPTEHLKRFETEYHAYLDADYPDLVRSLAKELKISDAIEQQMLGAADKFKSKFMQSISEKKD